MRGVRGCSLHSLAAARNVKMYALPSHSMVPGPRAASSRAERVPTTDVSTRLHPTGIPSVPGYEHLNVLSSAWKSCISHIYEMDTMRQMDSTQLPASWVVDTCQERFSAKEGRVAP